MRVTLTHLGHSELPGHATANEVKKRKEQMEMILGTIQQQSDMTHHILTGDLNLDVAEFTTQDWPTYFDRGTINGAVTTWGGDEFCKTLTGEPADHICS